MGAPNDLQDVEGWDSLAHVNLIVAIEREFKIRLTMDEIVGSEKCGTVDHTGVTEGRFVGPIAVRLKPEHRESRCEPLVLRINLSVLGLEITERRTCY